MRRRIKNLTQLNRTLGRFLSRTEKLCFLKSYLQNGRLSRDMQARWVKNILIGSQKADRLSFAKSRVLRKSASG
jgi:hypothetical protein